jgi:hypothetical protein
VAPSRAAARRSAAVAEAPAAAYAITSRAATDRDRNAIADRHPGAIRRAVSR